MEEQPIPVQCFGPRAHQTVHGRYGVKYLQTPGSAYYTREIFIPIQEIESTVSKFDMLTTSRITIISMQLLEIIARA